MKKSIKTALEWVFLIRCILFLSFLFTSCRSKTVYIPVESTKIEYRDKYLRDSIHIQDSIFIDRFMRGDTVFITKEKYKYLYRDKLQTDTVIKIDSIKVPYPVIEEKTVKAPYTWYEKVLMALGLIGLGFIGLKVYRWVR